MKGKASFDKSNGLIDSLHSKLNLQCCNDRVEDMSCQVVHNKLPSASAGFANDWERRSLRRERQLAVGKNSQVSACAVESCRLRILDLQNPFGEA